jgi:hypothetical protein
MGALIDYVKHLPRLKDSFKAVPTKKKGSIPFGEADLDTIVLLSVLISWQNQYNLNHSTVPKSTHTLVPDFKVIKQVMVEKKGANLKAKGKGVQPHPKPKVTRSARCLGARLVESLRKVAVRSLPMQQGPWGSLHDPQHYGLPSL